MFGWTIRDKLPTIDQPLEKTEEVVDQDKQSKKKRREYADAKRHAKPSEIKVAVSYYYYKEDVAEEIRKEDKQIGTNI